MRFDEHQSEAEEFDALEEGKRPLRRATRTYALSTPTFWKQLISEYDSPVGKSTVVMEPEDLVEVPPDRFRYPEPNRSNVMLMPEGTKSKQLTERSKWIAQACLDNKYRFSPRLHIDIWGNERGK